MKIWINIDRFNGFKDVSKETIKNVMSEAETDSIIGQNAYRTIYMLNSSNYLDDDVRGYLKSRGWEENEGGYRQNKTIYSYCFEKW